VNYLRLSVTDRCNLRCRYCVPTADFPRQPREEILRYEEVLHLVKHLSSLGIRRVRLTGGEPLVRPKLATLVELIRRHVPLIGDIALTTNGQLLASQAGALRDAGLSRINVSLDTLRPDRYQHITGGGELEPVLKGLETVTTLGFPPPKINVVLIRGLNDDEAADFARWTMTSPYAVRFIELMPLGQSPQWSPEAMVREADVRQALAHLGPLEEIAGAPRALEGPASAPVRYRLGGGPGSIAFISPYSTPFCRSCNRLRLTADGRLRLCLLSERHVDLRGPLRAGAGEAEIQQLVRDALRHKPRGHDLDQENPCHQPTPMCAIGG
jgi:cyclic pyranopterin phosphate synthase